MKVLTSILQNLVRILAVALLVLGVLFWSGHELNLIPVHMHLGETVVFLLWVLALTGIRARAPIPLAVISLLWGLLVVWFGMRMEGWLPGSSHVILRILHLILGLGVAGLAESLAARIKRSQRV